MVKASAKAIRAAKHCPGDTSSTPARVSSPIWTCLLKVIYKGCFKSFVALYADRICSDQHFVENRIEKFLFV